uniref:CSON014789 protein n=1 Tax=Culicoides sonorensis TaxID=179676 RepID=A0A336LSU8_CULSO
MILNHIVNHNTILNHCRFHLTFNLPMTLIIIRHVMIWIEFPCKHMSSIIIIDHFLQIQFPNSTDTHMTFLVSITKSFDIPQTLEVVVARDPGYLKFRRNPQERNEKFIKIEIKCKLFLNSTSIKVLSHKISTENSAKNNIGQLCDV